MAKEKDTKRILQAVVFHDRTYKPGDEDDLEQRLTVERCKQLLEEFPPVLAGDWSAKGKGEPAMPAGAGNTRRREAAGHTVVGATPHPAVAEAAKLKAENERLKAENEKHAKAAK